MKTIKTTLNSKSITTFPAQRYILLLCIIPLMFNVSSAQNSEVASLLESGHNFGQTEVEKELFPRIEKNIAIFREKKMILEDDSLQEYVEHILEGIIPEELKTFNIKVIIVKDPDINAAMYANGIVLLNTGLFSSMSNEAQLAFVLSHELAHFVYRHSLLQYYYNEKLLKKYEDKFFKTQQDTEDTKSKIFEYSQNLESEADSLGIGFYIDPGYRPDQVVKSLMALPEPEYFKLDFIGFISLFIEDQTLGPLPTHPKNEERIEFATNFIKDLDQQGMVGDSVFSYFSQKLAQTNLSIMKSRGGTFNLLKYLDETQQNISDSTSFFFKEIDLVKAEIYYQILEDPLGSGASIYAIEQMEAEEPIQVSLRDANKNMLKRFEEKKPALEAKLLALLKPLLNDKYLGYRAHKVIGLFYIQKSEDEKAIQHLSQYLESGQEIPDRRFINYLLNDLKNR